MRYFKKLKGERLYLSPINVEDASRYCEWINDMNVTVKLGRPSFLLSVETEKEALEDLVKGGSTFAIILNDVDKLIGNCGLMAIDHLNQNAELGIMIGDKAYWNNGYGTEAIRLLLNYGFNILNLHNIMLRVFSFNERAMKCYKKCGFKEIGRRRGDYVIGKERYDSVYMDILATEFNGQLNTLFPEGF
ncbi:MAG TPA: GNAT family protein [Thermotogota bacterium]|nr:GNAT family protein [Thermotogota bacterium]HPJ89080.1 GNAT family protein [Thermotogota bacterium]HPR96107.1 GNAT family protein [Thermotogota bacterium]